MCEVSVSESTDRLSAADIASITAGLRASPERWSLFPSVGCEGEVTLLAAPAAWSEEDWSVLMQRDRRGIRLLLSVGEALDEIGVAQTAQAAVRLAQEAAQRHRAAGGRKAA